MDRVLDNERLERLLEAGRGLLADLDLGLILDRLLALARELTGARYAALGILDERRTELRQFLTTGVEAWGNLYLTEKAGGEDFDEADEASVVVLADWAAIAIENARLYEAVNARRKELERAVRGFEATATIARAVGGETDL